MSIFVEYKCLQSCGTRATALLVTVSAEVAIHCSTVAGRNLPSPIPMQRAAVGVGSPSIHKGELGTVQ